MNPTHGSEKTITTVVVVLCLVLVGVMLYEWQWGESFRKEISTIRTPGAKAAPIALLPEFILPPKESAYIETLTRPIFTPSRRGNPAAKAGKQQMKKGQFVLSGVIIVPGQRLALLRDVTTGKSERVEQGREIRGMLAERVDPTVIVLKQGDETEELVLMVQRAPLPQPTGGNAAQTTPAKQPGLASVTVSEPARPLETDEQRLAERENQRQKQLERYQENNRIRAEKGLRPLPIPRALMEPAGKK